MVKCFSLEPMALEMLSDARERELEAQWFKRKDGVRFTLKCGGRWLVERMEKVGKIDSWKAHQTWILTVFFW